MTARRRVLAAAQELAAALAEMLQEEGGMPAPPKRPARRGPVAPLRVRDVRVRGESGIAMGKMKTKPTFGRGGRRSRKRYRATLRLWKRAPVQSVVAGPGCPWPSAISAMIRAEHAAHALGLDLFNETVQPAQG